MQRISEVFLKKFHEIEEAHLEMKLKVDAFNETGDALDAKLAVELEHFLEWYGWHGDIISDMVRDLDYEEQARYRDYTLNSTLAKILQDSPFFWRIVNRPEGYPGDAEMMNIIYRNTFEGENPFGRFVNRGVVQSKACQAVRNRKNLLIEQIMNTGGGKILSLAAGPAREIFEVLETAPDIEFDFLALDHDIKTIRNAVTGDGNPAVRYALANAFRIIKNDFTIAFPKLQFIDQCNPKKDFTLPLEAVLERYTFSELPLNSFDLVYSAGLYDYINTFSGQPEKGTLALTANLFRLLKPGGALVIGNMCHDICGSELFSMEYLQNWLIIKRTEKELCEFADAIPDSEIASVEILKEPEKINYFLRIVKK